MGKGLWITGITAVLLVGIGTGVGAAIRYGEDDTLPRRFQVAGLQLGGLTIDEALAKLRSRVAELESTNIVLGGVGNDDSGTKPLTSKQLGLRIEVGEATAAIERYRDYSWWERARVRYAGSLDSDYGWTAKWDEAVFMKTAGSAWSDLVSGSPENATRTIDDLDQVVYTEGKPGRRIDIAELLSQAQSLKPDSLGAATGDKANLTLQAKVEETQPEITLSMLKDDGLERKTAEFTTSFSTSGEGRSHNVTAAAKALNDTLLAPGEVFEYGKIVAKAEKEYGYKEAPVISKGKLTPGIGGGICQVSSTLYNAALLVGLDIVERRNHSLVVHYLPKGLDATFADGFVNFKFRNSTGKQLLIRTVVKDKTITVKLFGTMPDNTAYRAESEVLQVIPPKTVYVADAKIAAGKESVLQKGEAGYVVQSYLIKSVDGTITDRRKLSKDTYRTQDRMIAVNPADARLAAGNGSKTAAPGENPADPASPGGSAGNGGSGGGDGDGDGSKGGEAPVEPL
ncbi:VanW family protein [Cohnella soli]|uniref:VanW family protein n=1 Tax=Cohnella soli TaxID=425005 RepID=A0ABW0HME9_9BACL